MSDSNIVEGENNGDEAQPTQNGSSSESSDVSIEKLNPEEVDVAETKPTEDERKVLRITFKKYFDKNKTRQIMRRGLNMIIII